MEAEERNKSKQHTWRGERVQRRGARVIYNNNK